jgi:hypothetical protein
MADSLSDSWMGPRILATAVKSISGGGSTGSLPKGLFKGSVAGVGLGTDGAPDCEPREVTLVIVATVIVAAGAWECVADCWLLLVPHVCSDAEGIWSVADWTGTFCRECSGHTYSQELGFFGLCLAVGCH